MRIGSPAMRGLPGNRRRPRQDREEGRTFPGTALDADPPTPRFDDPLREREAEAGTGIFLRGARIELLELDEKPPNVLGLDPDSGVFDFEAKFLFSFSTRAHEDARFIGGKLQSVGEIVVENLLQFGRVAEDFADVRVN